MSNFYFVDIYIDKLKQGDKVKVLELYDGNNVVSVGWINSLSILDGANFNGTRDANVNIIKITNNVLLPYEDKIDRALHLKEKDGTFTRLSLNYL